MKAVRDRLNIWEWLKSSHPMVVVLQCNRGSEHPFVRIALGFYNTVIVIFLTLFFATTWGGTLFLTLRLIFAFALVLAASRTFSVWLCWWLEKSLCLTIIKCENDEEFKTAWTYLARGLDAGLLVENKTRGLRLQDGKTISASADCKSELHYIDRVAGLVLTIMVGAVIGAVAGLVNGGIWGLFASVFYGWIIGIVAFVLFAGLYGSKAQAVVPVIAWDCCSETRASRHGS